MLRAFKNSCPLLVIATVALATSAAAAAEETLEPTSTDHAADESAQSLDLRAPNVTELYTPEQINAFLARNAREESDDVEVEGTREPPPPVTPTIWTGIATPVWALLHPLQAWRVFLPFPPDQMRGKQAKPNATNPDYWPELPR